MIYIDRKSMRMRITCYLCYADGFVIEMQQAINRKEEIVGIGYLNQYKNKNKNIYNYKKKGYGSMMYRRISKLGKNWKNENTT